MQIFINSEKYLLDVGEITFQEVIRMAGFTPGNRYRILDERDNVNYYYGDSILLKNNMSLVIYEAEY